VSDAGSSYAFASEVSYMKGQALFRLGRLDEAADEFLPVRFLDKLAGPRFRRLGQIEDKRGNREQAIKWYARFVDLWQDCDPELRPQVDEARARLAALQNPSLKASAGTPPGPTSPAT